MGVIVVGVLYAELVLVSGSVVNIVVNIDRPVDGPIIITETVIINIILPSIIIINQQTPPSNLFP